MKFINTKLIASINFLLLLLIFSSCKKFIEIPLPVNQTATTTIFTDAQTATSAVNGLYSSMMSRNFNILNSGITLYPGLSADELKNMVSDALISSFAENNLNSNNEVIEFNLWKKTYALIYQTNAILEGLLNSNLIKPSVKNQLTGEAKFVRALCYFYLVNMFGEVPYIESTDYVKNSIEPRLAKEAIYNKIETDLKESVILLNADYPSMGKVRPNKFTAASLLARVYLYQKNWSLAEQTATQVINSGVYNLAPLNMIFLANSTEAIWQLMPVLTFINTADGLTFIPYSSAVKPNYILTPELLNSIETGDQRLNAWTKSNLIAGNIYTYPFKYKVRTGNVLTEYIMIFRLAELYLIRAEAKVMKGNLAESKMDINIIRNRAGLANTIANSQTDLLTAIEHERRIEFFAECGHRWFDLKRWNKIDSTLGSVKSNWQSTDALYPIPFIEIQSNPRLTQNAGY